MRYALALLVLLAACDPTGLGIDPTVDIENQTPWPAAFTWQDGQSVLGRATIPGNTRQCVRFFARADSAYWEIVASDLTIPSAPNTSVYTAPWFDPTARHAWSVLITVGSGSPTILMRQDSTVAAC
jgi:hypothetical protein